MVGFTRFCWSDGQLSKRFSLVYKWGDDIYGMLVAKLAEYGYIPDENTQLCIVCYDGVASTIEDSDSLWEAIEGFGGYGMQGGVKVEKRSISSTTPQKSELPEHKDEAKESGDEEQPVNRVSSPSKLQDSGPRNSTISGDDEGGVSNGANSHQRSLDGNIIRSGSRDDVEMRIRNLEEKLERMVIMLGERIECDQK
ncbi:unnamed protein product [Toxocara canis]|uniref:Chitin synthase n=1 Tax=Toxocara canis TaxID=6265 RepID=A0A183V4P8_TOXCA|nr:unnamed protein product [Toxocara canis]